MTVNIVDSKILSNYFTNSTNFRRQICAIFVQNLDKLAATICNVFT